MTRTSLQIDPEFAAAIPPLTNQERAQLEANILAGGCRDALAVWRGILLDGHQRYEICGRHGIPFRTVELDLPDRQAALLWAEENQLDRRNLTDDQRAAIAYRVQQRRSALAKKQRAAAGGQAGGRNHPKVSLGANAVSKLKTAEPSGQRTRTAVARQARVSERKLRNVAEVARAGPELVQEIVRGKVSIKQAQRQVHQQQKQQAKAAVPAGLPAATDRFRVICADISDVGDQVRPNSVDWIITDPPYEKKYLPVYDVLGSFAALALRPGGSLVCMVGHSYLPDVLASLCRHLTYHWTLAYLTPGGQAVQQWDRKVNTFWKPLLWLVKGKYGGDWVGDVCRSEPNDNDKQHHRWGQSESGMADIIERFTVPGQTVCDPFCGGGTTGVVAVRMNRLFVGIDCDADAVATTKARLAEVLR